MKRIYYHIIFWISYLFLEVYVEVSWIIYNYTQLSVYKQLLIGTVAELLLFFIKIPLIYTSFFVIKRYSIDQKKHLQTGTILLLLFSCSAFLSHVLVVKFIFPFIYDDHLFRPVLSTRIVNSFIDLLFCAGIANAVKQYRYQVALRDQEEKLLKEKLTAELISLKAQLHPHFLFNTLNSIYALARKKSDQTPGIILKLSALLRFILYEAENKSIPITQEITILENYIELERIRFDESCFLSFTNNVASSSFQITPLLLLPFVENAFKHGASEIRKERFIRIDLQVKDNGTLLFTVENNTEDETCGVVERIGLRNVRRQLELIYPDHCLTITKASHIFKIELIITLTGDVNI
jgi:two-component system LytT family sensor kinase